MKMDAVWFVGILLRSKTFEVVVFDSHEVYKSNGKFSFARNIDCSISLICEESEISVNLIEMISGGLFSRRSWVEGDIVWNGAKCGTCRIENTNEEECPLIDIEVYGLHLAVWKSEVRKLICPLYVSGFKDCDFILADKKTIIGMAQLPPERRRGSHDIVGICCPTTVHLDIRKVHRFISLIAVIVELHVRPYYMSVGP
jgi:hypothetical protein